MEKIIGLIDAPFTPFYANGDVNLEPIEAYAKMLQKNGLKGVFINGSSGEGYMLTTEERMLLAERWVAVAPKDFKIIVHVGSCCLRESRRLAEHAQKLGVWGIKHTITDTEEQSRSHYCYHTVAETQEEESRNRHSQTDGTGINAATDVLVHPFIGKYTTEEYTKQRRNCNGDS